MAAIQRHCLPHGVLPLVALLLLGLSVTVASEPVEYTEQQRESFFDMLPTQPNSSSLNATELEHLPSIADIIDQTLRDEFPEGMDEFSAGKTFNTSINYLTARLETVLRVIPGNPHPSNDDMEHVEMDVDRIIDTNNNEFVLSSPKGAGSMALRLDPVLIRDLTILLSAAALAGAVCEAMNQPVINGYLLAGSIVGPGGLAMVSELVQLETLAQVGVQLLLFGLGLEFDLARVKAVQGVALLGGVLEIVLFTSLGGLSARFAGWSVPGGLFVGALVAMSSTSVVVKCLEESGSSGTTRGQIMIGTLILQDLSIGLFFAFMPLLGYAASHATVSISTTSLLVFSVFLKLSFAIMLACLVARTVMVPLVKLMEAFASPELLQLCAVTFCMSVAWASDQMALSAELGAFVAGVMLSVLPDPEEVLHKVHQIRNLFVALFLASIGLIMSPVFLMEHLRILLLGMCLVVLGKTLLIATVVWVFKYPVRMALGVGLGLAQVGEFAFVLLSEASQMHLIPHQGYMMLLGVTALSLLITPVLMKWSGQLIGQSDVAMLLQKHKSMTATTSNALSSFLPGDGPPVQKADVPDVWTDRSEANRTDTHHRSSCLGFSKPAHRRKGDEVSIDLANSS
mmetsp:Transcript_23244/g.64532  ORF Transcript_23244/g.64532 Transcript_23244/m.64532 type:complete len:625 (+) Transcript_23244:453-2327(+)